MSKNSIKFIIKVGTLEYKIESHRGKLLRKIFTKRLKAQRIKNLFQLNKPFYPFNTLLQFKVFKLKKVTFSCESTNKSFYCNTTCIFIANSQLFIFFASFFKSDSNIGLI